VSHPVVTLSRVATIRERKPGVREVRAFTGNSPAGVPTQVSRTVRGTKKDMLRVAGELKVAPAGRSVSGVLKPCGHLVHAEVTTIDKAGQHQKKRVFCVRMNNGTRSIDEESEVEKYVATRWGNVK
jgi:hypothetical protein